MMMQPIDWLTLLSREDYELANSILNGWRPPDLIIAPDGKPYLYRWHVIPQNNRANVYFHIQVASDPERPLHDHPWDNTSVILSGGYEETYQTEPRLFPNDVRIRNGQAGNVIFRRAHEAHRLELVLAVRYTMTLFTTGPKYREWGFWYPEGWVPHYEVIKIVDGVTINTRHK